MITEAQAIKEAAQCLAEGYRQLRGGLSVEEAARAAYTPTGPSIPELETRIREYRARMYDRRGNSAEQRGGTE